MFSLKVIVFVVAMLALVYVAMAYPSKGYGSFNQGHGHGQSSYGHGQSSFGHGGYRPNYNQYQPYRRGQHFG